MVKLKIKLSLQNKGYTMTNGDGYPDAVTHTVDKMLTIYGETELKKFTGEETEQQLQDIFMEIVRMNTPNEESHILIEFVNLCFTSADWAWLVSHYNGDRTE